VDDNVAGHMSFDRVSAGHRSDKRLSVADELGFGIIAKKKNTLVSTLNSIQ
jgi:hypothetical protein